MATLDDIAAGVTGYFDSMAQAVPAAVVIEGAAESAVYAINAVRCYNATSDDGKPLVENRYKSLAIRIAVYLCEKQGVDGVSSYSENGVSRSFETGDIPPSLLGQITPVCKGW